jgi:type IV fimbrial biogenesis protein FimT
MNTRSLFSRGFTLIELLVTVALVAILLAVAAPSFTAFQRNAELTSFVNSLVAGINSARGEAMKRGRYAMVVPTNATNWSSGWIVFVDVDRSQAYEAANDILILSREAPPSYLTITANGSASDSSPYMMFDASGYSKTKAGGFGALTFSVTRNDVDSSLADSETRRVIISSTGRVRTCKPSTDSTCTSSATQ